MGVLKTYLTKVVKEYSLMMEIYTTKYGIIWSQNVHFVTTVPLTRTGVLYPHMRDFYVHVWIYNWTISNAYISVNSQLILVKFWILHLMTNPNNVYDTTLNLNHSKSQLISTTPC